MTKVRVVIEYDLQALDVLTVEDGPTIFECTDGSAFWADCFTVDVLE